MDELWQDLRLGVRLVVKNFGFTILVVITLALGIGGSTAIFSVVNAVLLRPLPYEDPDRLVMLSERSERLEQMSVSLPDYYDWRERNTVFQEIAVYRRQSFNLTGVGEAERIDGAAVSASLFPTLGVSMIAGRPILSQDDQPGANPVAVISYGLWQRSFGSDQSLVGNTLSLNGMSFTVVGIARPDFKFPRSAELWVPLGLSADRLMNRGSHLGTRVIARLNPGVTVDQARANMQSIAQQLETQYPDTNEGIGVNIIQMNEEIVGGIRLTLLVVFGVVGFVLIIACANVANLLLVRASARQKEFAVRTALGASRLRLVRQLLTESLVLALIGGTLGFLLALWGNHILISLSPDNIPRIQEVSLDGRVLAFALFASILTGIIFGLAPALQASKLDIHETLKEGSNRSTGGVYRTRIRNTFVVTEVCIALVLLVSAGLVARSFLKLLEVDLGFYPDNVMTMQMSLPQSKYSDGEKVLGFYEEVVRRVQALPGVQAASASSSLPLSQGIENYFVVEGQPNSGGVEGYMGIYQAVTTDYFGAMGTSLLKGRYFASGDSRDAPGVVIVSDAMVKRFWPNEEPVGKRIKVGGGSASDLPWLSVVGVVKGVKQYGVNLESEMQIYVPFNQLPMPIVGPVAGNGFLVIRSSSANQSLSSAVRSEIRQLDNDLPVYNVKSMDQLIAESISWQRFAMLLLVIFAAVALVLTVIGIYGVVNYSVTQRTHEIGVRIALGARHGDVIRLVVEQGLRLAVAGVALGVIAALILTRILSSLLYGVSATDPLTYAGTAILLIAVAMVASYIPARKASRLDPMIALRYE
jgi:predicted permease